MSYGAGLHCRLYNIPVRLQDIMGFLIIVGLSFQFDSHRSISRHFAHSSKRFSSSKILFPPPLLIAAHTYTTHSSKNIPNNRNIK